MNKVLDFTAMLVVRTMNSARKFKEDFTSDERGALTFVEIALMVLIVVALAYVFRDKIVTFVDNVFKKLSPGTIDDLSKTTTSPT